MKAQDNRDGRALHVLTLTPFYPSQENAVSGCFIAEPIRELPKQHIVSTVMAAQPTYRVRCRPSTSAPATWVRYPQFPGNPGLSRAGQFLFLRLLRGVRSLHRQDPIDVIHAHAALPCGLAAAYLSRSLGISFVVTVHGLDVFHTCYEGGIGRRARHRVSVDVYRRAAKVICISDGVRRIIQEQLGDQLQCAVVYNGTDANLFSPAPTDRAADRTILIVGNLARDKGQELVLRAIAKLKKQYPDLSCRIIGEGPDRGRLQALSTELGIAASVEFLGRRRRDEVAAEMRACTVFALPSRNEGLGCVYLEAMASGKPVIGCRGQGIAEIVRHEENGWLIPPDGLDELTQGLSTLLSGAELRARIGHAARQTILRGLTLSDQAQQLARIYREAAA